MTSLNQFVENEFRHNDLGKAILRISFSVLFLLHGIHNVTEGMGFIQQLFMSKGLPGFFAYGVYIGEILVPVFIIIGAFTRLSALIWIITDLVIVWLAHSHHLFSLNQMGAWAAESIGVYLFAAITILLLGAGKYSFDNKHE